MSVLHLVVNGLVRIIRFSVRRFLLLFFFLLLSVTFSVSDPVRVIRFGVSVTSSRKWSCQNHSVQRKVCFQCYV